jgi:hypothetical protein
MSELVRLIARLFLGIAQFCAVGYVAFVTWLMGVWMIDDHWAAHAHTVDWCVVGLKRLLIGVLVAAVVGIVLLMVNRFLERWCLSPNKTKPSRIGLIGALVVVVASLMGTLQFILTRPYL